MLSNLREPIPQFGNFLKNLALEYAKDNKKVMFVPLQTFTHGLAQIKQSKNKYDKKSIASDTFIEEYVLGHRTYKLPWRYWELDGTKIEEFNSKYRYLLRALIEGRFSIFIITVDKITGEFEYVGAFNILQGTLEFNEILLSSKQGYSAFKSLEGFDLEFFIEFDAIMKLFKRFHLAFVPRSDTDISALFDLGF